MASPFVEKKRLAVAPVAFTADGTYGGIVTIADTTPFFVKQVVALNATGVTGLTLQVKRILSATQLVVGPLPQNQTAGPTIANMSTYTNISAFTVALGATIGADEQIRQPISDTEIARATYMEEPAVAVRTLLVDALGQTFTDANPLPVNTGAGKLAPDTYDHVHVNYDGSGNVTSYQFYLGATLVGTITLTYDGSGNVTDYTKT